MSSQKHTCIQTKYVLQNNVCLYIRIDILYSIRYILHSYKYLYMNISHVFMSNHDGMLDVIEHQQDKPCFFGGCLKGSGPFERSTSLLSQRVFMHQQTKTLTCHQFEHMWLGFNHRTNSGIGHGKNILTGHSKSNAWAKMDVLLPICTSQTHDIFHQNEGSRCQCLLNYLQRCKSCVYLILWISLNQQQPFWSWLFSCKILAFSF